MRYTQWGSKHDEPGGRADAPTESSTIREGSDRAGGDRRRPGRDAGSGAAWLAR